MKHIFCFFFSIGKDELQKLADLIVELFPNEIKQTYYSPHKGKIRARGKLIDAYYNYKHLLSTAGITSSRSRSRSTTPRRSLSTPSTVTSGLSENVLDLGRYLYWKFKLTF